MKSVFEFNNYRDFLGHVAAVGGKRGGVKTKLAQVMGSHPAYLSRIFASQADLSAEQAEKIAAHLKLEHEEKRYFLFLVEEAKAGTPALKKFYREECEGIQRKRLNIKDRIPRSGELEVSEQATYYSSWHYSAVYVLVSIAKYKDAHAIAKRLNLPVERAREALDFLERAGLIQEDDGKWSFTKRHLHIEKAAPLVRQHHLNWRLKSVQAIEQERETDLRYSGVFSLSKNDAAHLREEMMRHLNEYLQRVANSSEETAYVYCFDFFELGEG